MADSGFHSLSEQPGRLSAVSKGAFPGSSMLRFQAANGGFHWLVVADRSFAIFSYWVSPTIRHRRGQTWPTPFCSSRMATHPDPGRSS